MSPFEKALRDAEQREHERLEEIEFLDRRGLATWNELKEARQIERRQALREFRREHERRTAGRGAG